METKIIILIIILIKSFKYKIKVVRKATARSGNEGKKITFEGIWAC